MKVWEAGADFLTELKNDAKVTGVLTEADITALFDLGYHTKNIDQIFKRVFGEA